VRTAWPFLAAGFIAACSFRPATGGADAPGAAGDGADPIADGAPLGPWGTPTKIALSPPDPSDDDPTLTGDLLELYVNSSREGNSDIFVATRTAVDQAWSSPTRVAELSSGSTETTPEVSADGLTMYFSSDRAGGTGGADLWRSTRTLRTDAWGAPMPISELNDATPDTAGGVTPDGLAMAFASFRKANLEWDIYTAVRASPGSAWEPGIETAAVNTAGYEGSAFLSADRRTLYFDTLRDGGPHQLYLAERDSPSEVFSAPVPIAELNSSASDQDPWVSPDGRVIVFFSDRDGPGLWMASR
jgi:Tol biopolymer transport system component